MVPTKLQGLKYRLNEERLGEIIYDQVSQLYAVLFLVPKSSLNEIVMRKNNLKPNQILKQI